MDSTVQPLLGNNISPLDKPLHYHQSLASHHPGGASLLPGPATSATTMMTSSYNHHLAHHHQHPKAVASTMGAPPLLSGSLDGSAVEDIEDDDDENNFYDDDEDFDDEDDEDLGGPDDDDDRRSPSYEEQQPILLTIPSLVGSGTPGKDGLSGVSIETLQRCLQPVMRGLENLDALSLLQCEAIVMPPNLAGMGGGAIVDQNIRMRPIHDDILPPISDPMTVRYLHLSEVQNQYSMGIFVFPPHARIPLHDHPGMCVLSRILYGDVHRLSLDLERPDEEQQPKQQQQQQQQKQRRGEESKDEQRGSDNITQQQPAGVGDGEQQQYSDANGGGWLDAFSRNFGGAGLAPTRVRVKPSHLPKGTKRAYKNHVDHLVAPGCTILYPFEGNLHEFVAGPYGAAVLDVLLPPYDDEVERDCTFYTIHEDWEFASATAGGCGSIATSAKDIEKEKNGCWIVPTGQPEDFHCISGRYKDMGA